MGEIWAQQEGESNRWYQRFFAFCLMGTGRTIQGIFDQERARKGKTESVQASGSWRRAAKLYNWVERAEAYDKHLSDQKAAAIEARWQAEIMGKTEILGRLSRMGRANPYDFFIWDEFGRITGFNKSMLREHGDLVKRLGTKETAMGTEFIVELHDGQAATVKMGQHEKLFTDVTEVTGKDGGPIEVENARANILRKLAGITAAGSAESVSSEPDGN